MTRLGTTATMLYDFSTGDIVGVRDVDGGDYYFRKAYGVARSDTEQFLTANTATPLEFEVVIKQDYVAIDGSIITVARTGIYQIAINAAIKNAGNADATLEIWLRRNGSLEPSSRMQVTSLRHAGSSQPTMVATYLWTGQIASFDSMRVTTSASTSNVHFHTDSPRASPDRPALPSAFISVTQL